MCGRFQIDPNAAAAENAAARQFILPGFATARPKTREIFPADTVPVFVRRNGKTDFLPMSWGFPRWGGKGVVFNARAETAAQKPMFREHLLARPVAVPTTGFFEWKPAFGMRAKDKYMFKKPGRDILYLAGFAGSFPTSDGRIPDRFVLLTTAANEAMAPYHNRMPVPLREDELELWISGKGTTEFLERTPFALEAFGPL